MWPILLLSNIESDYTLCYRDKCTILSYWTCEHNFNTLELLNERLKQLNRDRSVVTMMIPFFKVTPLWLKNWKVKYYLLSRLDILHRCNPYDN